MKLLKLSLLTAAAAALVIGTGTVARADFNYVADGTYVFTATDGLTSKNGSSVTFAGDVIVDWNLVDSAVGPSSTYPTTTIPLTPSNSEQDPTDLWTGVTGPNQWSFRIISLTLDVHYYDFFTGQNNLYGPGVGGGTGALYNGFGDPDGNWNLAGPNSVPDASSTFGLFASALLALGACKSFLRRRA